MDITAQDSVSAGFEEYAWDALLLAPMDAGCVAFIVQTADVKFMVKTFARLAHSPQSTYRANRKFLYLPSRQITDDEFENIIKQTFEMREMDFMPDLVVAKLTTERRATPSSSCGPRLLRGESKIGIREMRLFNILSSCIKLTANFSYRVSA
jgi:hypothetical protein